MASNFQGAVGKLGAYAGDDFDEAHGNLMSPRLNRPVVQLTPEEKKEQATWQAQMASAFEQLGDAERKQSEAEGYDHVVALMKTTADTAKTVCTTIVEIMNALPTIGATSQAIAFGTTQREQIAALNGVLNALAALSPAAVWQKPADGE